MRSTSPDFKPTTWFLFYLGFILVYFSGLFIPLMQNDSAQHASMAMRMVLEGDYLHLFKGENPYLDKPHMHFWLSALSMELFGINPIAYRIPALLCILLGAYSTKKLAELLYTSSTIGQVSALIFLSAQTIVLSAHDVRTDAVLTGFVVFSIWQLTLWIKKGTVQGAILGGLGASVAFSAKGLMPLVIIGFCVLSYLLYERRGKRLLSYGFLVVVVCFFIGLLPILYAYYHQFGVDGIRFILLGQSVARMTGDGFVANNSDYFFFFHTLLWIFLPFSLAFYFGVVKRTKMLMQTRFAPKGIREGLTLGGFYLVLFVFSFSQFKLPHYLNGLIPILSILTASYLLQTKEGVGPKSLKFLFAIQVLLYAVGVFLIVFLVIEFSGVAQQILFLISVLIIIYGIYLLFSKKQLLSRYISSALVFSIGLNLFLNSQFYPVLTTYQGSISLAKYVNDSKIPLEKVFMLKGSEQWAFDFYSKRNTPRKELSELKKGDLVVVEADRLKDLDLPYEILKEEKDYRITRLTLKFLRKETREETLSKLYLLRLRP